MKNINIVRTHDQIQTLLNAAKHAKQVLERWDFDSDESNSLIQELAAGIDANDYELKTGLR